MTRLNELDQNEMRDVARHLGVSEAEFEVMLAEFRQIKKSVERHRRKAAMMYARRIKYN